MPETPNPPAYPKVTEYYPAPPHRPNHLEVREFSQAGMTLRDFFAAQCITGMLAPRADEPAMERGSAQETAERAYHLADAMLSAR